MENFTIRQHYLQFCDVLPHAPVPDCGCATGIGRCHAAQCGISARVYREEESGILESAVELLTRDAGFDCDEEILGAYIEDAFHTGEIEANYWWNSGNVPSVAGTASRGNS